VVQDGIINIFID